MISLMPVKFVLKRYLLDKFGKHNPLPPKIIFTFQKLSDLKMMK